MSRFCHVSTTELWHAPPHEILPPPISAPRVLLDPISPVAREVPALTAVVLEGIELVAVEPRVADFQQRLANLHERRQATRHPSHPRPS